jgi:hypothetical protein
MRDNRVHRWRESEWPAYYLKYFLASLLPEDSFRLEEDKKFAYIQGEYSWDVRVHSTTANSSKLSLTDKAYLDNFFAIHNGYGLIVITIHSNLDSTGEFRDWFINYRGGKSEYMIRKEKEGAKPRPLKTNMFLIESNAFYFPTFTDLQQGVHQGWLFEWASNMRDSNDELRNPKYMFDLGVRNPYCIDYRSFNKDLDDILAEEEERDADDFSEVDN